MMEGYNREGREELKLQQAPQKLQARLNGDKRYDGR
jgi:hypothetical protein